MNLQLHGKNALVCGGSKGIGKACAVELAALGANVTLVARDVERLGIVTQELDRSLGQSHDFLQADFSDSDDLRRRITGLLAVKPIHILINNTGGPPAGPILQAEAEAFLQAFHNHVICGQLLVQALAPVMQAQGYGRIINIISTSVKAPIDNLGVSNTIRAAVANWAKTLANELGVHGITVNNVLPGYTRTERLETLLGTWAKKEGQSLEAYSEGIAESIPLKRFGQPEEIAAAVAFLASPAAAYITGTNITVDGGRTRSL